ncbi:hypothetical protein CDAR_531841 [Caerostris darwini]|uniref:Uncharacterized protein n=1 Tax=Caerostris darwini TaxID=1538125 RepID=A0AAV4VAN8_9ARAC|nr:hypothetical protein CDAR_531841 [Caerostris darwini]
MICPVTTPSNNGVILGVCGFRKITPDTRTTKKNGKNMLSTGAKSIRATIYNSDAASLRKLITAVFLHLGSGKKKLVASFFFQRQQNISFNKIVVKDIRSIGKRFEMTESCFRMAC